VWPGRWKLVSRLRCSEPNGSGGRLDYSRSNYGLNLVRAGIWEIVDGSGQGRNASAGSTQLAKYELDVSALDEIKREGLLAFDSLPCLRSD
jgi:hypothetical protein